MQPPGVLWDSKRVLEYCRVGKLASDETGFLDMTYPMVSKVVCQRIRDRKVNMCIYEENKSTTLESLCLQTRVVCMKHSALLCSALMLQRLISQRKINLHQFTSHPNQSHIRHIQL